jgi:hypothetical protein
MQISTAQIIREVKHAIQKNDFVKAAEICNSVDMKTKIAIFRDLPMDDCRRISEMTVVATKEYRANLFNQLCR